jgi:hypothetical protein
MDPEHGMREEVFAKLGDEKGLAIVTKPSPKSQSETWAIRPNQTCQVARKGSFREVSYCTTIVSFVLLVRLAEPEANVPVTVKV